MREIEWTETALEQMAALDKGIARRVKQADDGHAGQRLAGARFAHYAQRLTWRDVKRKVVHGAQCAVARRELDAQVAHLEQRLAHVSAVSG